MTSEERIAERLIAISRDSDPEWYWDSVPLSDGSEGEIAMLFGGCGRFLNSSRFSANRATFVSKIRNQLRRAAETQASSTVRQSSRTIGSPFISAAIKTFFPLATTSEELENAKAVNCYSPGRAWPEEWPIIVAVAPFQFDVVDQLQAFDQIREIKTDQAKRPIGREREIPPESQRIRLSLFSPVVAVPLQYAEFSSSDSKQNRQILRTDLTVRSTHSQLAWQTRIFPDDSSPSNSDVEPEGRATSDDAEMTDSRMSLVLIRLVPTYGEPQMEQLVWIIDRRTLRTIAIRLLAGPFDLLKAYPEIWGMFLRC